MFFVRIRCLNEVFFKSDIQVGFDLDEDAEELQNVEYDPEVRPGLFQGDMALNNEVGTYQKF